MAATNFQTEPSLPKRLGEVVTLPYNGDMFTAADGTVWKATNDVPLAYSATYLQLLTDAPQLITSAALLPGPFLGTGWSRWAITGIVGATSGGATWLAARANALTTTADVYVTSTNAGATWTTRASPVAGKVWYSLWDGTNFVLYAQGTGATGVQESTDGITWTARTAVSIASIADIIYNGTVYLVIPSNGTTGATSTDRITWTSRTLTTTQSAPVGQGLGQVTWNAGAGLFITGTSTPGQYQTSPDGATWTARTTINTIQGLLNPTNGNKFVSDATATSLIIGVDGCYAYSTDGINWTEASISSALNNLSADGAYWDGTRFVVSYGVGRLIFYSVNGTSWTAATRGTLPAIGSALARAPGGISCGSNAAGFVKRFIQTDVTSTANTNIVYPVPTTDASTRAYMRVL